MEAEDTGSSGLKSSPKEESIQASGASVNIKEEPLDSMPPLASPATVVNVVSATTTPNGADKQRELEPSPPTTVISLAPAQPYPAATTQLTFAAPGYDITETSGPYTVQVTKAFTCFHYSNTLLVLLSMSKKVNIHTHTHTLASYTKYSLFLFNISLLFIPW